MTTRLTTGAAPALTDGARAHRFALPASLSRDATLLVGLLVGLGQALGRVSLPGDAWLYWQAQPGALYSGTWITTGYVYPPPFALALAPFHLLPWPVFIVGWTTLLFGALWYIARGWSLPLIAAGFVGIAAGLRDPVTTTLAWALEGNVQLLLAAAAVAGMRYPGAWAVPLLTKMAPGVGVLWYAFRGERRRFTLALGVTVGIAALTFVLDWRDWLAFLAWVRIAGPSPVALVPVPFAVLALIAVGIVAFAARTNRPWLVPVACGICSPALYMWSFLPYWIGAATLRKEAHPSGGTGSRSRRRVASIVVRGRTHLRERSS